jgi:hypothetical protein
MISCDSTHQLSQIIGHLCRYVAKEWSSNLTLRFGVNTGKRCSLLTSLASATRSLTPAMTSFASASCKRLKLLDVNQMSLSRFILCHFHLLLDTCENPVLGAVVNGECIPLIQKILNKRYQVQKHQQPELRSSGLDMYR